MELKSDGTYSGTSVWLVIEDDEGHEMRYKIPNVVTVELQFDADRSNDKAPRLVLGLGAAHVDTHVAIGPGRSTVEDLLAEIAAARLRSSDR